MSIEIKLKSVWKIVVQPLDHRDLSHDITGMMHKTHVHVNELIYILHKFLGTYVHRDISDSASCPSF